MADKTELLQAIDDAILDADSLERFINGSDDETVLTRLSAQYPTLQNAIKQMFENGGLPATPFKTKAMMTASALVDGDYAMVTDDAVADNNGLYVKTAGAWVKSKHQISGGGKLLTQEYKSDAFALADTYIRKASGVAETSTAYKATTKLPVQPNTVYKVFSPNSGNAANVWLDKSGEYISGFNTGIAEESVTSPATAAFVALSVKNADAVNAYFKSAEPKFSIADLMSVVNAHKDDSELDSKIAVNTNDIALLKKPMSSVTVVNSLKELIALNPDGEADKAYPIGRRVYDHSLRKTVTADGSFWRLEDGTPANIARRVYVYPDWDEIRAVLPTYAKSYSKTIDVKTNGAANWIVEPTAGGAATKISLDTSYGDTRVKIEQPSGTFIRYASKVFPTQPTLHDYLIFDYHIDTTKTQTVIVSLVDAEGKMLFYHPMMYATTTGEYARKFYGIDHVKAEVKLSKFSPKNAESKMEDVRGIGFSVTPSAGNTASISVGDIETVSFKPMITLRFDDQRSSVYENAYPVMQQYGLKGLIAVITGTPNLANSPNHSYNAGPSSMTKDQLLEVQSKGWDLVSHTHVHENLSGKPYDYMRADYKASRDYLRDELNVGDIASSCIISPFSRVSAEQAAAQREFFDAHVSGVHLNSHMPRQPTGTWQLGSLWQGLGCDVGDSISTADDFIAIAQSAIDEQRWSIVMMHDILPTLVNSSTSTIEAFTGFCQWLDANRDKIDVVTVTDVVRRIRPVD